MEPLVVRDFPATGSESYLWLAEDCGALADWLLLGYDFSKNCCPVPVNLSLTGLLGACQGVYLVLSFHLIKELIKENLSKGAQAVPDVIDSEQTPVSLLLASRKPEAMTMHKFCQ